MVLAKHTIKKVIIVISDYQKRVKIAVWKINWAPVPGSIKNFPPIRGTEKFGKHCATESK